jgi:hypothetical protein
VEPVALRLVLPAKRAFVAWPPTFGIRTIPSPDATLGDGDGRSAAIATLPALFANDMILLFMAGLQDYGLGFAVEF